MAHSINFLLLTLLFSFSLLAQQQPPGSLENTATAFDVQQYDVSITINNPAEKYISAVCTTQVKWNTTNMANYFFHLEGLTVDSVFRESEKISFKKTIGTPTQGTFYTITEANPSTQNYIIYYSGTMTSEGGQFDWGGVHYKDGILFSMGVGFFAPYVSTTRHWMPCFDHPQDKATLSVTIFAPKQLTAIANGVMTEELVVEDNFKKTSFLMNDPGATYLYTFALGDFQKLTLTSGEQDVTIYHYPGDKDAATFAYSKVANMITAFEQRFGKYPFESIGYYDAPLGSMEHQTMITMDRSLTEEMYAQQDATHRVAAHELAHQWFGNFVTCSNFKDAWLNEGFASFSEAIWGEYLNGKTGYVNALEGRLSSYVNQVIGREGALPLHNFQKVKGVSNYPTTIYSKGALVLAMLRYYLGDEDFFLAVKEYLKKYGNSTATTSDLKSMFEKHSKKNLTGFFNEWVYQAGVPVVDIRSVHSNKKVTVTVKQVQGSEWGNYTWLPIGLSFASENDEMFNTVVTLKNKEQSFSVTVPFVPTSIQVNKHPEFRALMRVRNSEFE